MPPTSEMPAERPAQSRRAHAKGTPAPTPLPDQAAALTHLLGKAARSGDADARTYRYTKRAVDLAVSSAALLLLLPVFVLIAAAVSLEDGGPALYCQTRVGRGGARFRFYKFRSMVPHADALKGSLAGLNEARGPIFKMRHDPRVTRVGRFIRKYSLDELPQLVNVFRGEVSLIGPRPHLPAEVLLYSPGQQRRLTVKPGLVCLREVCGRSHLSFERWMELDLLYVEHRSLSTDFRILWHCIPVILSGHGAY